MDLKHGLEDKYTAESGRVFLNGTQALVRLPLVQMRRDRRAGLDTAAFVSGYRGSPLGAYDQQLLAAQAHLDAHEVSFRPGVNEDLAATAIWGTQQVPLSRGAGKAGVLGIWYGKGPGVDRSGDVLRHGNAAGSSAHGGVLCLAGDDHAAKSSTLPHQSDHAFIAASMPVLYPASVHEIVETGLLGIAMSRFSGLWVAMKLVSDTVETSAVVELGDEYRPFRVPEDFVPPEGGLNIRWPDPPLAQDERLHRHKIGAALAFARANGVDRTPIDAPGARFGIVASGKAFEDLRQALEELGLDRRACAGIGLRLHQVRMPWPLEPEGIRRFARGLEELLVVEERREIVEHQIRQQLYDLPAEARPRVLGKRDEEGRALLPLAEPLSSSRVARVVAARLLRLPLEASLARRIETGLERLEARAAERLAHVAPIERQPYFCSGCPHNTSTRVPEGSSAMAGIGCHYMVQWMGRQTATFTQMGGEGVPWTAIAPYVDEPHRFVNIGDGTYFHSGLLAIRAAVASGVNVTYKLLWNDAVAMTGGQPIDGALSPERVSWQLHAEGVAPIVLVSEAPETHAPETLAPGTRVAHRDALDAVQRELRKCPGTSAIVYVQTCAAEKRRRRKRGLLEDPPRRVFIDPAVCEGCGDCSVQSNCVSIEPLESAFGRKRRINQSSCNKDYSCLAGFCPSFVSVDGGRPRRRAARAVDFAPALPEPEPARTLAAGEPPWNIAITGVGGTGVLTVGAILGMAARLDGKGATVLDMAGLAQKGGAVLSEVRLAATPADVAAARIPEGGADLLLAADAVVAASRDGAALCEAGRTEAVVNSATMPVAAFVADPDLDFRHQALRRVIGARARSERHFLPFASFAERLLGDAIASNLMMLGYAWQQGLVPLGGDAIAEAIRLNGVAVDANLAAFAWGRRLAAAPEAVAEAAAEEDAGAGTGTGAGAGANAGRGDVAGALPADSVPLDALDLDALLAHRTAHLERYQDAALAARYRERIGRLRERAAAAGLSDALARAAAHNYARVLAYKDEYEVARLHAESPLRREIAARTEGDYRIAFHLAPPLLGGRGPDGRPRKREFGPWLLRLFELLRHGKRLRGTPFDPFGWSAERRAERRWIARYESDLALAEEHLDAARERTLLAMLSLPDAMRGFGPVKRAAMAAAETRRRELHAALARPAPLDLTRRAA